MTYFFFFRINYSDAVRVESTASHPEFRLKEADYVLFGVYQDWVNQNPGNNPYGGINKVGKWQVR